MENVTLIKLGGSIITNKEVPMHVRKNVLTRLVEEIARARKKTGKLFVVGHGQGSFAHSPALRYKTMDGFISDESPIGMAITQDSAAQLNRIVVSEFLSQEVPAVSLYCSNSVVTNKRVAKESFSSVLYEYLEKGLLPVTGGDVLVDADQGCTIWSTEKVLAHFAKELNNSKNYRVSEIIHVTEVPGVFTQDGSVIKKITSKTTSEVKKHMQSTKGFDVTGGMWHKIEESLELAKIGISASIVSGLESDNLYNKLIGKSWNGTEITK